MEKLFIDRSEKIILIAVAKSSEGLHMFTMYRRFYLSPGVIVKIANSLERKGLIERSNFMLRLSDVGRSWVIENRHLLFARERSWRSKLRQESLKPSHDPEQPYVPLLSRLSDRLLPPNLGSLPKKV